MTPDPRAPQPKAPPPPLAARAARPAAVRLRGSAVKIVGAAAALVLTGAFTWAFILKPAAEAGDEDRRPDAESAGTVRPSEIISGQPSAYDALQPRLPPPRTLTAPSQSVPAQAASARLPARPASRQRTSAAAEAARAARTSALFFEDEAGGAVAGAAEARVPAVPSGAPQPEMADYAAAYARHRLLAPLSPYEIKAGALIPAALLTAVDTSRPGPVVAVTTEPVFDSVTGRILLVPQGTRLLGNQGGDSAHGERRAYITWSRMILPDGRSLLLDGEAAADGAGAAGVPGRPDRRLLQLTGAALLSGAVSTLGEIARGGRGGRRGSVADAVSDAIAGQAVELGGRVLDRELDIKPRIVVGAGAPVAVLITKDLILEPVP